MTGGIGGLPPAAAPFCVDADSGPCNITHATTGWCLQATGAPVIVVTRWPCEDEFGQPTVTMLDPTTGAVVPNQAVVACGEKDWEVNQLCDFDVDGELLATVTQIFAWDEQTGSLVVSLKRADDPTGPDYVVQGTLGTCFSPTWLDVETSIVCGNTGGVLRQLTQMIVYDTRNGVVISGFYLDADGNVAAPNVGETFTVGDCWTQTLPTILDELEEANGSLADLSACCTAQTALLTSIDGNTDGIEPLLTQIRDNADQVEGLLTTIRDNADQVEPLLTQIEANTDGVEGLLTQIRDNADQVETLLAAIDANTDGVEALLTTISGTLTAIAGYVDGIEGLLTAANTLLTTIASTVRAEDTAHVSGHAGQFILGVRNDNDVARTDADGDYSPLSVDATGRLKTTSIVTATPATSGGVSMYRNMDVGATGQVIKGSPGQLYQINAVNRANEEIFLKLYNKATAPTAADVPVLVFPIDTDSNNSNQLDIVSAVGYAFSLGIGIRATNGIADNDNTNTDLNGMIVNIGFK